MKKITEKLATKIIIWTGTLTAVVAHIVWFSLWFLWKLDVNLLTNLVSLEAIFLAIFVLIAQNQQSQQMHAHHETTKALHTKLDDKLKQI